MAKKALLVGVNEYENANDLGGCVNDVLDMHFSLRGLFNFQTPEIRVLTDSRATKENILHRLKWLVNGAKSGDFLIFHFSGHGSQIRDRDGDEELMDGMDELICPHDMDWEKRTFITDDELNKIFEGVPENALLEVFLDCCHSGTGLREMGLPPPELAAEFPTHDRYLAPPADLMLRFSGEEDELNQRGFARGARDRGRKHHILWAACRASQTAADAYIDGRYHGAFSYYLNAHLRRNPQVSRKELLKKVKASLIHDGHSQVPQLEVDATSENAIVFE